MSEYQVDKPPKKSSGPANTKAAPLFVPIKPGPGSDNALPRFEHDFSKVPASGGATPSLLSGNVAKRDATMVAGQPALDLWQRMIAAHRDFLARNQRAGAAVTDADPVTVKRAQDAAAIQSLQNAFGKNAASFFWFMRGGGMEGESSPFWQMIEHLDQLNPEHVGLDSGLPKAPNTEGR